MGICFPKLSLSGRSFQDDYRLGVNLGEGSFAVVKEGTHKKTEKSYAIKIVAKAELSKEDKAGLDGEINMLKEINHAHIVRLIDVYDEKHNCYLVQEKMNGGELFARIASKKYYNEKDARDACKIIFETIRYIHSKRIVHRDLKPENLLLVNNENDWDIKLADFGFAKKALSHHFLKTQCGTPRYVAPEIIKGDSYGTKADMWSLGVILYIILGGYPPFRGCDRKTLFKNIKTGRFNFRKSNWDSVSQEAKQLISSLLVVDPSRRISVEQALSHPWIHFDEKDLSSHDLTASLECLKKFSAKKTMQCAVNAVIAKNKFLSLGEYSTESSSDDSDDSFHTAKDKYSINSSRYF